MATLVEQDPSRSGWIGSIASVFGQHLIYLDAYQAERPQQLDEVVEQLRWDIRTLKEEEALDEVVNGMMASYEVRRQ